MYIFTCVCMCACVCECAGAFVCACTCALVALLTQHAKRMGRIISSSVASLAPSYFSTLSHKRHDFRKTLLNTKCVFWVSVQLLSKMSFILRRIQRDVIINVKTSLCEVPVILARFQWNMNILYRFSKRAEILNLIKISPVGAELFYADEQSWRVAFRNFANAPKNPKDCEQDPLPVTPQSLDFLSKDKGMSGTSVTVWFRMCGTLCIQERWLGASLGLNVCINVSYLCAWIVKYLLFGFYCITL